MEAGRLDARTGNAFCTLSALANVMQGDAAMDITELREMPACV